MKRITFCVLISICLFACEKASINPGSGGQDLPVLEAYLVAGENKPKIEIFKQLPLDSEDTLYKPIEGLKVVLHSEDESFILVEDVPGIYIGDGSFQILAEKTYSISFEYNKLTVSATTSIPKRPENFKSSRSTITFDIGFPPTLPDPIELTWDNTQNDYFQVRTKNIETNPKEIDLFGGVGGGNNERPRGGRPGFSQVPQQSNSYQLGVQDFTYLGKHEVILYRVTPDYYSLVATNQNNGLTLTSPYTNVKNGLGIFTGVGADTLYVQVRD